MKNKENIFLVFCVVGQPGSGKDTLANFLERERGFVHISTGNIIRDEMKKVGIPIDRGNMRLFSEKMRKEVGNSYPANIAVKKVVDHAVISGPRNVAEVEVFKKKFGKNFILVAVTAPIEIRYARIKGERGREGDNITFEQFKAQEEAELNSETHELGKLLAMADRSIDNSRDKMAMFTQMDFVWSDYILKFLK